MVGGQEIDIDGNFSGLGELKNMHALKTGAIIRASGVIAAILSGASREQLDAIDAYCYNLGVAFQIQDDILDIVGTEEELGKPIGSDSENNKVTYVTLCGIDEAERLQREYIKKAKDSLGIFDNSEELSDLCDILMNRKA